MKKLNGIINLLVIISYIVMIYFITKLDILPIKYYLIFLIISVLLILLLLKFSNKITYIFKPIMLLIMLYISYNINITNNFLNKIAPNDLDSNTITDTTIISDINDIKDNAINILISGLDTYGNISKVSRSDVNIIVSINPNNHEVLLTSIPRDTYVKLHDIGQMDKLTHTGIYGVDMTENTIEDLLEIDIDYYIKVNFDTLIKLVDAIDGVDVYSDTSFSEYGYSFNEGINHLDGKSALAYSRIRHVFIEGDRKRGEHQKDVIKAIVDKISSSAILLTNYSQVLDNLSNLVDTNIPSTLIKDYIKNQLDTMPKWEFKSIYIDGSDQYDTYTYSMPSSKLYVVIPYINTINYCSKMINNVKEGISINEVVN